MEVADRMALNSPTLWSKQTENGLQTGLDHNGYSQQKWRHHRLSPSLRLYGCPVSVNRLEILHRSEYLLSALLYH